MVIMEERGNVGVCGVVKNTFTAAAGYASTRLPLFKPLQECLLLALTTMYLEGVVQSDNASVNVLIAAV